MLFSVEMSYEQLGCRSYESCSNLARQVFANLIVNLTDLVHCLLTSYITGQENGVNSYSLVSTYFCMGIMQR
jgi:hypothetical protein